ncbi:NADH dehydrogenase [ubiquinone] 1 alpha subcomplex subunit 6 [Scenedesmus sp. PABB004]|nr:NADH dehydrogenase [ubiquinone] 1 alpha subcomplex subunit 6 [Scenedesmus sp. PABB004]
MRLEELVSVRDIRAVIKERFLEFKDVTDPRVRPSGAAAVGRRQRSGSGSGSSAPPPPTPAAGAPQVIDLLIFKGREELEVYLTLHKQRHHAITEYLEPILAKRMAFPKPPSGNSAFLDAFLSSNYVAPTAK